MTSSGRDLLVNIDVDDLERGVAFYTEAFGLTVSRRFAEDGVELSGWPVHLYLLRKPEGSVGAGEDHRRYVRHWTPVHLDVVVENIESALDRALAAGARAETPISVAAWGKLVGLADPFGHGLCLVEFLGRGYDEIAILLPDRTATAGFLPFFTRKARLVSVAVNRVPA